LRIDILTIFPGIFEAAFATGIFQRAVANGLVEVNICNIRDYSHDKHHTVDDYPYGGGAGMVLKPELIFEAVEQVKQGAAAPEEIPVILLTPQGRSFSQAVARELSQQQQLIIICGHYEGVDERVHQYLANDQLSIGDYVLSGGEPAALVVVDAVVRLLPGVLGSEESIKEDSHSDGLLEYPQYTRPAQFKGWPVPEVLLSGDHARIARWRRQQSIIRTLKRRPELLDKVKLNNEERQLVSRLKENLINNTDNALLL
jgi:tRNA (guanine37-N1)-methyltransferase